ncbi:choice-of-anchor R domain-containing protein [Candidatus Poriferisodalis sp.]|uniref:choice-of-anchor R domain-containing protein n=1 Tax=Candidatus Poriferisodalis sp. TaxID=3101277 RepID=UPI003B018C2A
MGALDKSLRSVWPPCRSTRRIAVAVLAFGLLAAVVAVGPASAQAEEADCAASTATACSVTVGGARVSGTQTSDNDVDWFSFSATAGQSYLAILGSQRVLTGVYDSTGDVLPGTNRPYEQNGGSSVSYAFDERDRLGNYQSFSVSETGTHFISVNRGSLSLHDSYYVELKSLTDDFTSTTATTGTVTVGGSIDGNADFGFDVDWIKVVLEQDVAYVVTMTARPFSSAMRYRFGRSHMMAEIVGIYDSSGAKQARTSARPANEIDYDFDEAIVRFEPASAGSYFIAVTGHGTDNGPYTVSVAGEPAITFGSSAYAAVEGGAAVTVEAVIPEAPTTAVTVPLSVSYGGGATAEDHSAIPASVTFDVAATKATFTVSAANDSDDDDGESVTISFGAPPSGHTAAGSTTVSFVDNDGPVLVGNTGQYEKSAEALVDHDHAQRFTTGSNTDGYSLTSVDVRLETELGSDVAAPAVSLVSGTSPSTGTATALTAPASLDAGSGPKKYSYTAPSGTRLDASTSYWIVVESAATGGEHVHWTLTWSDGEDRFYPGWSIEHQVWRRSASAVGSYTAQPDRSMMLQIHGTPVGGLSSLALSGVDFGAFDWGTRDYSATAAATVSSATLTYEAFDDEADVVVSPADADTVTDGHQVGLAEGANTVTITVTAPDGTVTVYTVTVDRAAESQSATVQFVPGEGPIAQQQAQQQQAEQQQAEQQQQTQQEQAQGQSEQQQAQQQQAEQQQAEQEQAEQQQAEQEQAQQQAEQGQAGQQQAQQQQAEQEQAQGQAGQQQAQQQQAEQEQAQQQAEQGQAGEQEQAQGQAGQQQAQQQQAEQEQAQGQAGQQQAQQQQAEQEQAQGQAGQQQAQQQQAEQEQAQGQAGQQQAQQQQAEQEQAQGQAGQQQAQQQQAEQEQAQQQAEQGQAGEQEQAQGQAGQQQAQQQQAEQEQAQGQAGQQQAQQQQAEQEQAQGQAGQQQAQQQQAEQEQAQGQAGQQQAQQQQAEQEQAQGQAGQQQAQQQQAEQEQAQGQAGQQQAQQQQAEQEQAQGQAGQQQAQGQAGEQQAQGQAGEQQVQVGRRQVGQAGGQGAELHSAVSESDGGLAATDCSGDVPIVVAGDEAALSDHYSAVTLAGVVGTDCVVLAGGRDQPMSAVQRSRLDSASLPGYVVGGTAAVPDSKVAGYDLKRLAGDDRWHTARLVGVEAVVVGGGVDAVDVAASAGAEGFDADCSGDIPIVVAADEASESDRYSAVTLAGALGTDCVVLAGDRSDERAIPADQLARLRSAAEPGFIVGGVAAVSPAKVHQVYEHGLVRIAGKDRWQTARLVGAQAVASAGGDA